MASYFECEEVPTEVCDIKVDGSILGKGLPAFRNETLGTNLDWRLSSTYPYLIDLQHG